MYNEQLCPNIYINIVFHFMSNELYKNDFLQEKKIDISLEKNTKC